MKAHFLAHHVLQMIQVHFMQAPHPSNIGMKRPSQGTRLSPFAIILSQIKTANKTFCCVIIVVIYAWVKML